MTTLKDLNATINKTNRSKEFGKHFAEYKASTKNILAALGAGHEKTLTKGFDKKFENLLVADNTIREQLINIVTESFTATVDESERLIAEGSGMNLPERVGLLVREFTTRANANAEVMGFVANLVTNNDEVQKFLYTLEKDGVEKNDLDGFGINLLLMIAMKYIITAGYNYVVPTATDEAGNPVDVEVVSTGAAAHTADDGNQGEKKPESAPEQETATGDSAANNPAGEESKECRALAIVKLLKNAQTGKDFLNNVKTLLVEVGDTASPDMINMVATALRPYSVSVVNELIDGFSGSIAEVDETNENYDYAKNVILGMMPHNWETQVKAEDAISALSAGFASLGIDLDAEFDKGCVMITAYAMIVYRLISMTGSNDADVVNGYKMVMGLIDLSTNELSFDAMLKMVTSNMADFETLMKRVNKQIERPWERKHGLFDVTISGLWESSAKTVLETGLATIKKAMAA